MVVVDSEALFVIGSGVGMQVVSDAVHSFPKRIVFSFMHHVEEIDLGQQGLTTVSETHYHAVQI